MRAEASSVRAYGKTLAQTQAQLVRRERGKGSTEIQGGAAPPQKAQANESSQLLRQACLRQMNGENAWRQ